MNEGSQMCTCSMTRSFGSWRRFQRRVWLRGLICARAVAQGATGGGFIAERGGAAIGDGCAGVLQAGGPVWG